MRTRKRIKEAFGWIKTVAGQDKTKSRGRGLVRLPKLIAVSS